MGVTFIGNPFDQDNDYDDSDWEFNLEEEWVAAPQLVEVLDRAPFNIILAAGAESSGEDSDANWPESNNDDDSDEDYIPEDDYDSENDMVDTFSEPNDVFDAYDENDDDEEIDYVTYPINDPPLEIDKTSSDAADTGGNNDTD